ncbi:MAG: transposase [Ruminococcaceae bacterium]|nr:transposase [Oscillospiraceae bacterium]
MPRQARKRAESGIYHVMLRGIDRQTIFEDSEDYDYFMGIMQQCRQECGFKLYAYCLMNNHIHILLKAQEEGLETIFKRIGGRYVYYYNVKYRRVGHLFQDRFKSEPVEDDTYFLTVLRYIHQNPVKAKLCKKIEDYPYSSYTEYLYKSTEVDTDFVLSILSKEEYVRYNNEPNNDKCLEIATTTRQAVTDQQARDIIKKYAHCQTVVEFQSLDDKKKEQYIKKIYEKGVSIRQASRLTGVSKGSVEKWLKS